MSLTRRISTVAAAVLLAPTPAHAHGDEIVFLFEATPFVVPIVAVLMAWSWDARARQKLLVVAAVAVASAATFGLTYSMWAGDLLLRFGIEISLGLIFGMMLAHIVIPAAVWTISVRVLRGRTSRGR